MEKELTLLEKYNQGYTISHSIHGVAVQVLPSKIEADTYLIEWKDEAVGKYTERYVALKDNVHCTPPRERRWVNVWANKNQDHLTSSYCITYKKKDNSEKNAESTDDLDFIATLCIERVDGRWQLVKDENA